MLKIEISNRHYNGDFGIGSIFEEKYAFQIDNNICHSNSTKLFCGNGELESSVNTSISFILKENDIQQLNDIIKAIQSNKNYLYNESHYKKDSFDFNRYSYVDVLINEINYELSIKDDENVINQLKVIFRVNKIDEILNNSINDMISKESNNE